MSRRLLSLLFLMPLLGTLLAGGDTDIAALKLGRQLMGPPVTAESLVGKVVMAEFWGTH